MKRLVFFLLTAILLVVLCSCELSYKAPAVGKISILVYGNDYRYGTYYPNEQKYYSSVRFEDGTVYSSQASSLKCTVSDATEVGKALCALAEKAGYKDSVTVTYLTDYAVTNLASFKSAISDIATDSSDNDITILYFSCHGFSQNGKGKKVFYGTDVTEKAFVVFRNDFYPNENILYPISEMLPLIEEIKGSKVIISDFCYSGALVRPDYFSVTSGEYSGMDVSTLFDSYRNRISADPSLFCLSAARYYEESYEDNEEGHGYFTNALLTGLGWDETNQCLTEAGAEKNGRITLFEIARYVTAHDNNSGQTPMLSGGSNDIVLFSF